MSRPKQHHYVPQVYLRHFCTISNRNQLYFYDKVSHKTVLTNIKNIAQEKDFYSDMSKEDSDHYEKYYSSNVEPVLGKLLDHIIARSILNQTYDAPLLTSEDRRILSDMLFHQMFRTPNTRAVLHEKADAIMKPFAKQLLKNQDIKNDKELRTIAEKYLTMNEDTFKSFALPLAIDKSEYAQFFSLIDTMICVICDNQTKQGFITSDNPVVVFRELSQEVGLGCAGLGFFDSVIVYPITPCLAVYMVHDDPLFGAGFKEYENRKMPVSDKNLILKFNRLQGKQSIRQIYSQNPFLSIS